MNRFIEIRSPVECEAFTNGNELPPFDPEDLVRHAADAHWALVADSGGVMARCSLWWQNTPPYHNHRLGLIGHYAAHDALSAHCLLQHACEELAARHCTLAVGPIDGNTQRRYRLIIERGTEPPFFMEPDNPDDWPVHFQSCGFTPLAYYRSALHCKSGVYDARIERVAKQMAALNVRIRQLDPQCLEDELRLIYSVSSISFRNNFLYMPIAEAEFIQQYLPMRGYVRSELVLIAEHRGRPIGFLFAIPDLMQARRGQAIDTVIVKTVAVLPGRAYAGLGHLLGARAEVIRRELGYARAIHALMHESNDSLNWSARYGRVMRRYALFGRSLQS